ncbi:MAG: PHP domain-containing protein [Clostridia bacterium]|nr:PHP domain-containing protein [Clostridia bacterium]
MRAFVDLHIHSALSPCSSNEMTPNNIVNMAWLKGLDIIAVTDHNTAENCSAVLKCAKERNLLVVPGMELETREEVHVICLFPSLEKVLNFQKFVYAALPSIKNREDIFGEQWIIDENDEMKGKLDQLLITAAELSLEDTFRIVGDLSGVVIPAHIDRNSYSLISNLGLIPETLPIQTLEVSKNCDTATLKLNMPYLDKYRLIKSSDAHQLGDILEKDSYVELEELSIECLIRTLKFS